MKEINNEKDPFGEASSFYDGDNSLALSYPARLTWKAERGQKNISSTDYLFFVILSFTSILLGKEIILLCCFLVFML